MIATDSSIQRHFQYLSDNKSETSTEGDEYCDFQILENFVFPQNYYLDLKTGKSKVKSSLCKNFTEKGFCPYGQKCQFAHGTHQLRINMDVNNSYKTKPCNAFFKKGHCQYGYRCNFVHHQQPLIDEETKWKKIYENHRQTLNNIKQSSHSKLLKILN